MVWIVCFQVPDSDLPKFDVVSREHLFQYVHTKNVSNVKVPKAFFPLCFISFQVPDSDLPTFDDFLKNLKYPHFRETDNPAYKRFLASS